jgi:hypothetical protein
MPTEQVFTSSETKKRWTREANDRGLTLDEYMAILQPPGATPKENGDRPPSGGSTAEERRQRRREQMDEMQEMAMSRWMMGGGGPPPNMDGGQNPMLQQILDRLGRLEDREPPHRAASDEDDFDLGQIMRMGMKFKMAQPLMRAFDSGEGAEGGSKLSREIEKELRDRMEAQQEKMLGELRARDAQLTDLKDKANEQRIEDLKTTVRAHEDQIAALIDQLRNPAPGQGGPIASQLTEALKQAADVQAALDAMVKRNAPPPPTSGGQRDTVETIAYLANELGGAVSKGLEAVARVNAANRGISPDSIGHMPPPGATPPVYQPQYAGQPPAGTPPPRAPPPRPRPPPAARQGLRTGPSAQGAQMGPGAKLTFEGARPSAPPQAPAAPEGPEEGVPEGPPAETGLQPLDPRIEKFLGPDNQPISREEYEAARLEIFRRTGRDVAQVMEMPSEEAPAPPRAPTAPSPETPSGDSEPDAGAPDSDSPEGQS